MVTHLLLIGGGVLLVLALSHRIVRRLPLTAALVYLVAGWATGLLLGTPSPSGWQGGAHWLAGAAEAALLVSLFAVGLRLRHALDASSWRASLLLAGPGMVLAVLMAALAAAHWLALPWPEALLLGALLAPTDPVLAAEVQVRTETDRDAVRRVLTAEGALNDATAAPAVLLALGLLGLHSLGVGGPTGALRWWVKDLLWPMAGAAVLGIALGRLLGWLLRRRLFRGELLARDELLYAGTVALGWGLARLTQTSAFLLVFCTGLVLLQSLRSVPPALSGLSLPERCHAFGSRVERLMEAATVLGLGLALHEARLDAWTLGFALTFVLVVRPVSVLLVLALLPASGLLRRQRRLLAWFGIRGLGSLYYLALALQAGLGGPTRETLVSATLLSIALSILLHGVSVTPLMRAYQHRRARRHRAAAVHGVSGAPPRARAGSAGAAAPHQVDDGQQDHGPQERDQQGADAEDALVDRRDAQKGRDDDAGDGGAHDAHDDVQQDALLTIGVHQEAGDPADHSAHHEQHDEIDHEVSSKTAQRGHAGPCGNPCALVSRARRDPDRRSS